MPFDFEDEDTLPAEQMNGPVVVSRGSVRVADFSTGAGPHVFGGPFGLTLQPAQTNPVKRIAGIVRSLVGVRPLLHRVLTLDLTDPILRLHIDGLSRLPLVYGFVYDGCRLKYRVTADDAIELLEMNRQARAADWPYADYPEAFAARPFTLKNDGEIEPAQVSERTWQGINEIDPSTGIVAIVPPSSQYGVSLWGDGDDELVQVVFEIDPASRTVTAYNQCG